MNSPHGLRMNFYRLQRWNSSFPNRRVLMSAGHTYSRLLCNVVFAAPPIKSSTNSLPAHISPSKHHVIVMIMTYRYDHASQRRSFFFHSSSPRWVFLSIRHPFCWPCIDLLRGESCSLCSDTSRAACLSVGMKPRICTSLIPFYRRSLTANFVNE